MGRFRVSRMKIERGHGVRRLAEYPAKGEQLDALWKIVDAILPHLPAAALDAIPRDGLAVLEQVGDVKSRFPKRNPK